MRFLKNVILIFQSFLECRDSGLSLVTQLMKYRVKLAEKGCKSLLVVAF